MSAIGQRARQQSKSTWIRTKGRKLWKRGLTHLLLILGSLIFIAPLVLMLSTSLKAQRQIIIFPPPLIPDPVIWRNYSDVFYYAPLHRYFFNTLLICVSWVFGATCTSSLAAYAFARLRAPGRNAFFLVLLSTLMVPGIVTMIPTYILFAKLDWVDSFRPLTVPALFGSAFFIFLMRQFFMTIPKELEDAALIDGCTWIGIWWRIMLPLAKPALATVAIFAFTAGWNDFLGPLIYLNNRKLYTLSLGLQVFRGSHSTEWGLLMAASTMMVAPIILLFFFTQKQFVQGITLTGMKG